MEMLSKGDTFEIVSLLILLWVVMTWGDSLVGFADDRITDWRERRKTRKPTHRPKLAKPGDDDLDLEAALLERGPLPAWEDTRRTA